MSKLIPLELKNQRVLTTEQLAEVYETETNNIKVNFFRNKGRFVEGVHYFQLEGAELQAFKNLVTDSNLVDKRTPRLYLWTERGASRHCKILDTEKAWEQFDYLEDTYFRVKDQISLNLDGLSPQLQLLIRMEQKQKELESSITHTNQRIDNMQDVIALNPNSWREEARRLIVKIAATMGGNAYIKDVTGEIYNLLEQRGGVNLTTRLTNKRRRMADEGACKSQRDKVNKVDIIAEDKKLVEIYLAILKEMAIKYGVAPKTA